MEAWKDELYHHGILGMKWGVRRYQNPDGSLTEEGKKRYRGEYKEKMTKVTSDVQKKSALLIKNL